MMLPTVMYGSEFIAFRMKGVEHEGYVEMITSQVKTSVSVYGVDHSHVQYPFKLEGESRTIEILENALLVKSSKPIVLIYVVTTDCTWHNDSLANLASGDVGFSILVPNALFYFTYIWSMEMLPDAEHYVAVIAHTDFIRRLRLDDEYLDKSQLVTWDGVKGKPSWYVGHVKVNSSLHILEATKSSPFGCYVYGATSHHMYIQTVNYRIALINLPCVYVTMYKLEGDEIDNDCDGQVDEEVKDNKECPPLTWGDNCTQMCLHCYKDCEDQRGVCLHCKSGFKNPSSQCTESCGPFEFGVDCLGNCSAKCGLQVDCHERRYGNCKRCAEFRWGKDCLRECKNCADDCDKSYGNCTTCQPGYQSPETGCDKECPALTYGHNCLGSCLAKCDGKDCYERVFGKCIACPDKKWGEECTRYCENCSDPCRVSDGICDECKPGYKNPHLGCNQKCGVYEYGTDCRFPCKIKCGGADCFEREFGTCKGESTCRGEFIRRSEFICRGESICKGESTSRGEFICKGEFTCRGAFICKGESTCRGEFIRRSEFIYRGESICKGESTSRGEFICKGEFICRVNGGFGPWQMWECTEDCSDIRVRRTRVCDTPPPNLGGEPCDGEFEDFKVSDCYYDDICPEKCPKYQWGGGCIFDCYNCEEDCHKFNGSCSRCMPGFKNPEFSCKDACEENEWGANCLGDCRVTCGRDCIDRVTGSCGFTGQLLTTGKEFVFCFPKMVEEPSNSIVFHLHTPGKKNLKHPRWRSLVCLDESVGQWSLPLKINIVKGIIAGHHLIPGTCPPVLCFVDGARYTLAVCPLESSSGCVLLDQKTHDALLTGSGQSLSAAAYAIDKENHEKKPEGDVNRLKEQIQPVDIIMNPMIATEEVCEEYRWGINCRNSCINCLDDCNKYNGTCNRCMPFYRSPMDGCQTLIVDEWQSWECSRDCDIKQMLRERICHHSRPNCTTTEWKPGNCYVDSCPRDCPTLTWGVDCNNTCDNCETDCDKFNGSCSKCKPGYKNPKGGCHEECDRFSFGKYCKGNCKSKCDQDDCVDRKSGECPVHGKFGPWTPWYCTRNCMDPRMTRERFCNRPTPNTGGLLCTGPTQEWRDGSCYQPVDRLCPSDCPKFFWGVDCEQSCANCLDECDKFYGNCSRCKRGFKYPDRSCSKGCDRNEFGYDCKGSCAAKCGADCKERVHGYCKDPSSILVATIFGMFVAIPVVVYILKRNMLSGEKASQSED
ncbi:hypothetical protein Btru_014706 [Bulinus truncatus]|nr:hypothetical protein Btru_014706 [Bulinus truncatus]